MVKYSLTDRTDRTNWKWLHGSYEPYGSWKGFTGSRIQLFNRWKNQVMTKWSLEKFVDPYGSYGPYELNNGFTDRANRTVREKDLRMVNRDFNRWKSQVVTKWKLRKFVDPYGPYELKMAITDRTNRTVREKHLRIVNKVYQSVEESVCDQGCCFKNSSIRTDCTDRTNWKWLHGSYEPYGSW